LCSSRCGGHLGDDWNADRGSQRLGIHYLTVRISASGVYDIAFRFTAMLEAPFDLRCRQLFGALLVTSCMGLVSDRAIALTMEGEGRMRRASEERSSSRAWRVRQGP
jgi:hypothetical protein